MFQAPAHRTTTILGPALVAVSLLAALPTTLPAQEEGGCSDLALLREEEELLTGGLDPERAGEASVNGASGNGVSRDRVSGDWAEDETAADQGLDPGFWSASELRRERLEEWSRRVQAVRDRGLALDDARSLATLLYGPPRWIFELGDFDDDLVVCQNLSPLVVEGFAAAEELAARETMDGREPGPPVAVVVVRGTDGRGVHWSREDGVSREGPAPLLVPNAPLTRASIPGAAVRAEDWRRWRELLREQIEASGCLGEDPSTQRLLLAALGAASSRAELERDLAALRGAMAAPAATEPDVGAGSSAAPPAFGGFEPLALRQGKGELLGVRLGFDPSIDDAGGARPTLVRLHAFREDGELALTSTARLDAGAGAAPRHRLWFGSAEPGRYCVVARAWDLDSGRAGAAASGWASASALDAPELTLELSWRRAGQEIEASVALTSAEVAAVGFRVGEPGDEGDGLQIDSQIDSQRFSQSEPESRRPSDEASDGSSIEPGDYRWSEGPDFSVVLALASPAVEASVEAVAVDAERRVLARARSSLSVLPARPALRVRVLEPADTRASGGPVIVADVTTAAGLPLESVTFRVDGETLERQTESPFLLELPSARARPGAVVEAIGRFEGGDSIESALILGAQGVVADEVAVRLLELPFRLRGGRRGRDRALTADDVLVSVAGNRRRPDDLLFEESLPLRAMLLVDVSSTMLEERRALGEALERFARSLKPTDQAGLMRFDHTARVVLPLSRDHARLADAAAGLTVGGGTALLDAVLAAVAALPGEVGRRAVVLLTDGLDEHSQVGVELVDEALERARVALYPIHVEGGHLDPRELTMARAFLEVRARRSGGAYCFARDGSAIDSCLRDIAAELRSTYLAVVRLREGEDGRDAGLELARGAGARLRVP